MSAAIEPDVYVPRDGVDDAECVIVCVRMPFWWNPNHPQPDVTEQFLASYDPDHPSGAGWEWTRDLYAAMRFADVGAAWLCWMQVNRHMPIRPTDGQPNRPLTCFTISVEPIPGGMS